MSRFLCIVALLGIALPAYADPGPTLSNSGAGFSYIAPEGWSVQRIRGLDFPVAMGPVVNQFSANINVVDNAYAGSVEDYAAENEKTIEKTLPGSTERSSSKFVTASGLKGIKIVARDTQDKVALRQTFYFFPGHTGRMLVVTCTALAGDTASSALFDAALKTFTVH